MSSNLNRRTFLGQTAATSAAVGLSLTAQQALANSSANNKVVVAVMGLSRGRSLAKSFAQQPNVEVKYLCDVDQARHARASNDVTGTGAKAPQAIVDFRKALEDKEVDALVCAAPNHWHAPATIMACGHGKHVYVEKPCSHNPREGELMVEAARKHKRAVQMGSQRRSGPGTQEAMRRLAEGVIGRVYLVRAYYNSARSAIPKGKLFDSVDYDLWQGPAPRRKDLSDVVHYNWHWRWHWGKGELGINGVHTLDLCRWGLGVKYPIRVNSSGGRYHFNDVQETPDTHQVSFEFAGDKCITWQGLSCNSTGSGFVEFYGTKGTLFLDSNGGYRILSGKSEKENKRGNSRGDIEHIGNFLTAIREDKPLQLNAEILEGHRSTLLCHLGNIAQRTGRTLNCDPKNGHILEDPEAAKLWAREYEKGWEPKV